MKSKGAAGKHEKLTFGSDGQDKLRVSPQPKGRSDCLPGVKGGGHIRQSEGRTGR